MLAFTICSNNYLAQAKTLGDSWVKYHPEIPFKIILVDKQHELIDYSFFPFEIIPAASLGISYFDELTHKYDIVELNTAIKPDAFIFLFNTTGADCIIYLDPDILVVSRHAELIDGMVHYHFAVTPHITKSIDEDDKIPTEHEVLRTGLFNLGFLALTNSTQVKHFLAWWKNKLRKWCYVDWGANYFYDQSWVSYLPCLWDDYWIIKHSGYNVAYWNLHERFLSRDQDGENYLVNHTDSLRFFHFSDYKIELPEIIAAHTTRFSFETRPDLAPLYSKYSQLLRDNRYEYFKEIPYAYERTQASL